MPHLSPSLFDKYICALDTPLLIYFSLVKYIRLPSSENDTPEFLKAHAKKLGVTNPNWHFLTGNRDYIGDLANEFDIYVGDKDDQSESLNHSGMLALVDKEGNVRCRFGKDGMPILYYSGLNYDDQGGKNASLKGKFQPDRKLLIEDIQKLLEE